MRLVWGAAARTDLLAILGYIADRDAALAESLNQGIQACVEGLADRPYTYPPGRIAGTREALIHPNYGLTYRTGRDAVEILSVAHTCQQFP
ncbi:MAG: type II toxin-antitoxin system RelE/ParE family toxin [Novosphingobium sp.]